MAKPFRMDYKTYDGKAGTPREWRAAFNATMGTDEARTHVGNDAPEGILGIVAGAAWSVVVSAYRACALACHPDRCMVHGLTPEVATARFKRVTAAYTLLKARYGR